MIQILKKGTALLISIGRCFSLGCLIFGLDNIAYGNGDNGSDVKLTMMSYNVWFDESDAQNRFPGILNLISNSQADIIFLQEVTPLFIQNFTSSHLKYEYSLHSTPNAKNRYGLAYLSKKPLFSRKVFSLPSQYDRKVFFTTVEIRENEWLILANAHLESGSEWELRQVQIKLIVSELLPNYLEELVKYSAEIKISGVVWAGDFNIEMTEKHSLLTTEWTDVAVLLNNSEKVTYDIEHNTLASSIFSWFQQSSRPDRFYIYSKSNRITVLSYNVLDKLNGKWNTLSDHYPVLIDLQIK